MAKLNLADLLAGIAEGLSHLANGVALPRSENQNVQDIVNNILANVHKIAVPDVKISKADIEKVLKPLVEEKIKDFDARLKALEGKSNAK